jgi:hypothetical protein
MLSGDKRSFIMARTNAVVTFTQHDDGTQTYTVGGQSRTFDPAKTALEIQTHAMYHGFKQRISDKAALSRDPKTGKSATPEQKRAAVWAIIDHYESGTDKWDMPREPGNGGGRSDASYIMQALAMVQDVDLKTMAERVAANAEKRGITVEAYLKRVATSPAVAEAVARIKHGESEDADEILDELAGDAAEDDDNA